MSKIKIFSDSTCDLPINEIKRMDIGIIPLTVSFDEEVYKDGVEITPRELFELVDVKKILPKTSAPSPIDFYSAFKPYTDAGCKIIYIGLSSKLSTTIQNAILAANHLEKESVYIIDSLNVCGTIGGLVRHAYEFKQKGMSAEEITENLKKYIPNYKLFFTVERLDYLHMGGRCSSTSAIFGKMLDIKPIISMSIKGLDVWKKVRGKRKAINLMIEEALQDSDNILNGEIHLAYSLGNEKEGQRVKEQLMKKTGITKIHEYTIGCVISSHCGEGTIGFGYFLE